MNENPSADLWARRSVLGASDRWTPKVVQSPAGPFKAHAQVVQYMGCYASPSISSVGLAACESFPKLRRGNEPVALVSSLNSWRVRR